MESHKKSLIKFSSTIAVITFVLAAIFSVVSQSLLSDVIWIIGLIIVFLIVLVGVLFDMLGIAATAANEKPFHAMAAEKVHGAKEAVRIIRSADKFATFCNDVIGDISGIVSGTASAIVVIQIANLFGDGDASSVQIVLQVILTSFVAAITVGGKAFGKFFALHASTKIVFYTGKFIAVFEQKLKIRLLPTGSKKK